MYRPLRILLIMAMTASVCGGANDESPFNVDFFAGWDGHYRPMTWMPVEIGIAGELTQPFSGTLTVSTTQDGLNTLNVSHQFVLTPDLPVHAPLVTKLAFAAEKCEVRLSDERGRVQWRQAYSVLDFSGQTKAMVAVAEQELLIGVLGNGGFGLLQLGNDTECRTDGQTGQVYVTTKVARMMPWDWTGYVCLDLLVLYDPDWSMLNRQQLEAIGQWVSNGGRMLLIVGGQVLTANNPVAQMLPFELGDLAETTLSGGLLRQWRLDDQATETVKARPVQPRPEARRYRMFESESDPVLYATASVGFGAVGVLGVDPRQFSGPQRANAPQFWVEIMSPLLEGKAGGTETNTNPLRGTFTSLLTEQRGRRAVTRTIAIKQEPAPETDEPDMTTAYSRGYFQIGAGWDGTNMVMEHLYNIPQMRPLSIWWVILLLTLLAVLLGPVDYLLLKRFDRLPLTWLTSAGWIVLFTVGAYYGVQALRGGRMQLRTVSVCDSVQGDAQVWNTTYAGLFAPYSGDFTMEGFGENHWWSAVAPSQQNIWMYGQESGRREVSCMQHDGANLPYSLPVSIWTIQCLMGEWAQTETPFNATIHHNGREISLRIDNHSDRAIRRGFVVFDDNRGLEFEGLGRGAAGDFTGPTVALNAGGRLRDYAVEQTYHDPFEGYAMTSNAYTSVLVSHGCLQRTQAMETYLAQGAAIVCVEYDGPPAAFGVKGHSHRSHHVCLARQVVFPIDDNEGMGQ